MMNIALLIIFCLLCTVSSRSACNSLLSGNELIAWNAMINAGFKPATIYCSDNAPYYILEIDQAFMGLGGTIPLEITLLSNLTSLSLSWNAFEGPLPSQFSTMPQLQYLVLNDNKLSGTIPPEYGGFRNLRQLDLYHNLLTGTIPPELGNISSLVALHISSRGMSGTVPKELGKLSNLQTLIISDTPLTGTLPEEFGNLTSLVSMWITQTQLYGQIPSFANISPQNIGFINNKFNGTVPSSFGNIAYLDLGNNQMTGTIPPSLFHENITYISLCQNQLTGTIPPEIERMTNVVSILLNNNKLIGSIPARLSNMTQLVSLYLYDNLLNGTLPLSLTTLPKLTELWLSRNLFFGPIPPQYGGFPSLSSLRLDDNHLSGALPPELSNLQSLKELNVRSNLLVGSIPPRYGLLKQLEHLDLSRNLLGGRVPVEALANLTSLKTFVFTDVQVNEWVLTPEIAMLPNLTSLALYNCNLTDPLPNITSSSLQEMLLSYNPKITYLPPSLVANNQIKALELAACNLQGTLPANWSDSFVGINLRNNYNLYGTFPNVLTKLPNLETLQINDCNFHGPLPQDWSQSVIQNLWLSSNAFTGTLPPSLAQMSSLRQLGLSNTDLNGTLPYVWTPTLQRMYIDSSNFEGVLPPFPSMTYLNIYRTKFISAVGLPSGLYLDGTQFISPEFCLPDNLNIVTNVAVPTCNCSVGYVGKNCTDFDECWARQCGPIANCTNSVGSFVCTCPQGKSYDPAVRDCKQTCGLAATVASGCELVQPGSFCYPNCSSVGYQPSARILSCLSDATFSPVNFSCQRLACPNNSLPVNSDQASSGCLCLPNYYGSIFWSVSQAEWLGSCDDIPYVRIKVEVQLAPVTSNLPNTNQTFQDQVGTVLINEIVQVLKIPPDRIRIVEVQTNDGKIILIFEIIDTTNPSLPTSTYPNNQKSLPTLVTNLQTYLNNPPTNDTTTILRNTIPTSFTFSIFAILNEQFNTIPILYVLIVICILPSLLFVLSLLHHRIWPTSSIQRIFITFIRILTFISKILMCIFFSNYALLYNFYLSAVIVTGLPCLLNYIYTMYFLNQEWRENTKLDFWISQHPFLFFLAVLLSGLNTASVNITSSIFLGLYAFNAPMSAMMIEKFNQGTLITVLLSDIPNLIIQVWFLYEYSLWSSMVMIALCYTALSVLFTLGRQVYKISRSEMRSESRMVISSGIKSTSTQGSQMEMEMASSGE